MTKLFRKIVIPVFCLICGFYVKQKLVNLYNLDVSLLIDYLLVYIPATISNSILSFILDNTKFVSYMMSSGNGDNASNIGGIMLVMLVVIILIILVILMILVIVYM